MSDNITNSIASSKPPRLLRKLFQNRAMGLIGELVVLCSGSGLMIVMNSQRFSSLHFWEGSSRLALLGIQRPIATRPT